MINLCSRAFFLTVDKIKRNEGKPQLRLKYGTCSTSSSCPPATNEQYQGLPVRHLVSRVTARSSHGDQELLDQRDPSRLVPTLEVRTGSMIQDSQY